MTNPNSNQIERLAAPEDRLDGGQTFYKYNHSGTFVSQWGVDDFRSEQFLEFLRQSLRTAHPLDTQWQGAKKEIEYFRMIRDEHGEWEIIVRSHIDEGEALVDDAWWAVHDEHAPQEVLEQTNFLLEGIDSHHHHAIVQFHDDEIHTDLELSHGEIDVESKIENLKEKLREAANEARSKSDEAFENLKERVRAYHS